MANSRVIRFVCFQQPSLIGNSFRRQIYSGPRINTSSKNGVWNLRRFLAYQTKETVRAIPVEQVATKARWTADRIGKAILAGGSAFGIASLCVYGLGLTNEAGAIDRMGLWSEEVKARVHKTYGFFTYSLASTAGAAYLVMTRSTTMMRFMSARPIASLMVFLVGGIGSMIATQAIPYTPETLPLKIGALTLFSGITGITLAPLIGFAGPFVARAAAYTAGVVGGLTLTAMCAPSEKYLNMGGPLALGLGVVFVSSIGSLFAAPGGVVFAGLQSIYMYGGLVLFGGFVLYDTQRIIHHAENDPKYDPINRSIGIYLDTINIFIRILMLMAGSGNRRR